LAHRYGIPVPVERDAQTGQPRAFVWHGATYEVAEVVGAWHLMDRWWEAGNPSTGKGYSDRWYYRVRCPDEQLFDLYYDEAQNVWVLDRAHD
jgi:hypothetical protein